MPVPPEVTISSGRRSMAAASAAPNGSPSATTATCGSATPCRRIHSAINGPVSSTYPPPAARVDAMTTCPRRTEVDSALIAHPEAGLAALLALDPDVGQHCPRVDRLDHVVQG